MRGVVLAAGLGVRLLPLTENRPKHMLPVGGRPLLEHTLLALKRSGITDLLFVVGYRQELIQNFFGDGSRWDVTITYVSQREVSGTAAAISLAESHTGGEDFLAIYGDLLVTPRAVESVVQAYKMGGQRITMGLAPVSDPESYGVARLKGEFVLGIVEKPPRGRAPSNLANAGIYVLNPDIFEAVERTRRSRRGELEVTDSISSLAKAGLQILGVRLSTDDWMDIGRPWDLLEANVRVLSQLQPSISGEVEQGVRIVGPVVVSSGAKVESGTVLEGPLRIGEGSRIGPSAHIRPHTSIGSDVVIGNFCEIKNSIIMNGTRIPHLSYVGDSIIGERCNLGAGTNVANLRLDERTVPVRVKNAFVDSRRRKLGVIMGDEVRTGINSSLMPGTKIGSGAWIGAGEVVTRDVPSKGRLIRRGPRGGTTLKPKGKNRDET